MAHISKAQICNLALAHLKQTKTTIANLDTDKGNTAVQCRIHYDIARRFVLTDHDWNFATKRVALADVGNPPALWAYRYDDPSDSLKIREIERVSKLEDPIPFVVESNLDDSGLSVITDRAGAIAVYTYDVVNPSLFSPGYVSTFSWYLASELVPALSGSEKTQEACLTVYRNLLAGSQATDSGEGQADPEFQSPWERARI